VLGSRKPEAKRFKKWVTGEVLPSIRKTGRYQLAPHSTQKFLAPKDEAELSNAVNNLVSCFWFEKAWRQAVWFALRQAAGRPSPKRFLAADLPALRRELARITQAAQELSRAMCEAEREVILRVVRRGEDGCALQDQLWRQLMQEAKIVSSKLSAPPLQRDLLSA